MNKDGLLVSLRSQSTFRLLCLSIVTLGVYTSYYMRRQTRIFNRHLQEEDAIPEMFVSGLIIVAWTGVAMLVPYMLVEEGHPVELLSDFIDLLWGILALAWSFTARKCMNTLLSASKKDEEWFNGIWTFIFTVMYFNYKVNSINEAMPLHGVVTN